VHLLTGTNEHEVTLFQVLDASLADLDDDRILTMLAAITDRPAPLLHAYREMLPDASSREVWSALATDAAFRMPAVRLATAQHEHGPAWMYRFTWETPVFGGALRSTHALEIPFVFDNLDQPGADQFTGDGPERAAIAGAMHRAWIAFVRTGDPGWPAYEPGPAGNPAVRRRARAPRRPRRRGPPGLGASGRLTRGLTFAVDP
jgi:para-nitrobenzyl esterase